MAFDLKKHLEDHAYFFKEYREIEKDHLHFNVSFSDLQFIGRDKEKVMMDFNDELKKSQTYKQSNGYDRNGKPVPANRTIHLGIAIVAEALHFEDPDGSDTMPHWHYMLNGDEKSEFGTRLGISYSLLRLHISTVAEQFDLTPNFDVMTEHNPQGVSNLTDAVNRLTWSWKKMTNDELRKDIDTRGLNNAVKILTDYCLKTNNLTYYVKSMEGLKTRLNRLKLDVEVDGHNLRNTYPIPLTKNDMKVIELIKEKRFNQKDIKPYLKNPILIDFVRHSAKTTKPFIITALKEQTSLLDRIYTNKKAVDNFLKLSKKTPTLKKSRLTKAQNKTLSVKSELGRNLKLAAQSSTNEKELRSLMQDAGYEGFCFKKTKGSISGCFYIEDGKKQNFKFIDINVNWSQIKRKLMENTRKRDNGGKLEKKELHKRDLKPFDTPTQPKPLAKTVKIEYKTEEIVKKKAKAKERSQTRRMADEFADGIREFGDKLQALIEKIGIVISNIEQQHRKNREIEADTRTANKRNEDFRERITEANGQNGEIETKIAVNEQSDRRSRELRERIAEAKQRNTEIKTKIASYEQAESTSNGFVIQITSSEKRNEELRERNDSIDSRIGRVRLRIAEVDGYGFEESQIKKGERRNEGLRAEIAEIEGSTPINQKKSPTLKKRPLEDNIEDNQVKSPQKKHTP